MTRRFKKIILLLFAIGLFLSNTDAAVPFVMRFAPKHAFLLIVIVANIQAFLWYILGRRLVAVLGEGHSFLMRIHNKGNLSVMTRPLVYWGAKFLYSFNNWPETKKKMDKVIQSVFLSKKWGIISFLAWVIVPGSRSLTAIIFGMDKMPRGLVILLIANTLHIALSFGFWELLAKLFNWVIALF